MALQISSAISGVSYEHTMSLSMLEIYLLFEKTAKVVKENNAQYDKKS